MLKKQIEKEYGEVTNEEFSFAMDKYAEVNGSYLGRDAKYAELNELTNYIDDYRRFAKAVGRQRCCI